MVVGADRRAQPLDARGARVAREAVDEHAPDAATLPLVADRECDLAERRIVQVANEPRNADRLARR